MHSRLQETYMYIVWNLFGLVCLIHKISDIVIW